MLNVILIKFQNKYTFFLLYIENVLMPTLLFVFHWPLFVGHNTKMIIS